MKLRCGKILKKKILSKLNKQQKSVVFFFIIWITLKAKCVIFYFLS